MNSKRLPGKVLLPLDLDTVLGQVLKRCKSIHGVDEVVCAIPLGESGLRQEAEKYCRVSAGPEDDVLRRYAIAAETFDADIVMRITADCPLICPDICGAILASYYDNRADYCSNTIRRTFPKGYDCEVFSKGILNLAAKNATDRYAREHVTPWIRENAPTCISYTAPWKMDGNFSVDTYEDYCAICAWFGHKPGRTRWIDLRNPFPPKRSKRAVLNAHRKHLRAV